MKRNLTTPEIIFLRIAEILRRKNSRPFPDYLHLLSKLLKIKLGGKTPLFGSAEIINVCNLKCKHCYWWLNREVTQELTAEQWREVAVNTFKKSNIYTVTLVGGEPLLRPDVIEVFAEELPHSCMVVTNGTHPLKFFEKMGGYWVSIDGTETIHNEIRLPLGKVLVQERGIGNIGTKFQNAYQVTKKNVEDFTKEYGGEKVWVIMTVNSLNYRSVEDVVREWTEKVGKIGFQFHTPFAENDPLWLPYGKERSELIDRIIELRGEYPGSILNPKRQLDLLKGNWAQAKGTSPGMCPTWAILALDHLGRVKKPCCIGSAELNAIRPICEKCGLSPYSYLFSIGVLNN